MKTEAEAEKEKELWQGDSRVTAPREEAGPGLRNGAACGGWGQISPWSVHQEHSSA